MKKVFKNFEMILYHLDMEDFITYSHKIPAELRFEKITAENLEKVKLYHPDKYRRWKLYVDKNIAHGCIVLLEGKIIGYGWLKTKGVIDNFYKIRDRVAYMSEFFVNSSNRGKNIYPAMIFF